MAAKVIGLPRVMTGDSATHRIVLKSLQGAAYIPGPVTIHGSGARDLGNANSTPTLRPGLLMGMNSTTKKYVPAFLGYGSGAISSGDLSFTVPQAVATELARRVGASGDLKLVGPSGTIAHGTLEYVLGIHYTSISTTSVILSGSFSRDAISLSLIGVDDGSYLPKAVIPDGYGVKVTSGELTTTNVDVEFQQALIGGIADASQLISHQAATTEWGGGNTQIKEWLKDKLRLYGGAWTFDDDLG